VILNSGKVMEARVQHCRGSVQRPLTDADVSEKALAQLRTVYPARAADDIHAHCWRIGECAAVAPLCQRLAADATEN
jgi:2-methylcitrate dehydratase PrpD